MENQSVIPLLEGQHYYAGLTKREYFAALIMQAIIASGGEDAVENKLITVDPPTENYGTPEYFAALTAKATMLYLKALETELSK